MTLAAAPRAAPHLRQNTLGRRHTFWSSALLVLGGRARMSGLRGQSSRLGVARPPSQTRLR